jgi:hypothetical protein
MNTTTDIEAARNAERIYHEWDATLARRDIDAALKLYTSDGEAANSLNLLPLSAAQRT